MVKPTPAGAHYGWRDWLAQRVTAVMMALYTIFMCGFVLLRTPKNYADWKLMFSSDFVRVATIIFLLSLFYHAWIGVRDILMDYIKPTSVRLSAHVVVLVLLLFYAVWSFSILWGA